MSTRKLAMGDALVPRSGTESLWQRRNATDLGSFDYAVVGGGIVGLSVAYWLRRQTGSPSVVLLEQGRIASQASGRNAGFLLQGHATSFAEDVDLFGPTDAALLWSFTLENRELVLATFGRERLLAEERGSLTVAGSVEEADRLRRSSELLATAGFRSTYLPEADANDRTAGTGFFGALEIPTGAAIDPVLLACAVRDEGDFEVFEGVRVLDIRRGEGGCELTCEGCAVRAGQAIVATNAAVGLLLPELSGVVMPRRAQMLATAPLPLRLELPVYSHEGYYYVRQLPTGELLAGGARHRHVLAEVGFGDGVTVALQDDIESYLDEHFPWSAPRSTVLRWSGTMGFTSDRLPRLGSIDDRGLTWIAGFSGHGMSMAFLVGRVVAVLLASGTRHPVLRLFEERREMPPAAEASGER